MLAYDADLSLIKKYIPSARGLLTGVSDTAAMDITQIDGEGFWDEYNSAVGREQKFVTLKKLLNKCVLSTLKMNVSHVIDDSVSFKDMGLDSLMMIEMKNSLQTSLGKRVNISLQAIKDCKTIAELSNRLVELLSGEDNIPKLTLIERLQLAEEDLHLPNAIHVDDFLVNTLTPIKNSPNSFPAS